MTIIKIVAVGIGLYFVYVVRDIILLLVISIILSSGLTPMVEWLYVRIKIPRAVTVIVVYLLVIGLFILVIALLVPALIQEFGELGNNIGTIRAQFSSQDSSFHQVFERYGLGASLDSISQAIAGLTSGIFERTLGLFSAFFDFVTVLVISFYLVIEQNAMKDFVKSLTPSSSHIRIANVVTQVQKRLGAWLLGQFALMASIFALTYLGLKLLDVKYALVLSLFAGLLEIVPYLGPILSAVPAVIIGFLVSPTMGLFVIILYIIVQQVENYLLVPRIIGRSIGANPLIVLVALLIGYNVAGLIGVLISAPIVAVITVIAEDYSGQKKLLASEDRGKS